VDVAYEYLVSQAGVKRDVVGAGGASCGVNESIQLARRHAEVKSLVLLSGPSNLQGRQFLKQSNIPVLGAGAEDDEFNGSLEETEWLTALSSNPGNQFIHYKDGGHGIQMFKPHPELADIILNWYTTTLIKTPGKAPVDKKYAVRRDSVLAVIDSPGGAAKLQQQLKDSPGSVNVPENAANLMGYEHSQAGDHDGAIEIFKLIVAAYPQSPNAYDSLADGYVAAGQTELAKQSAQKAIELLPTDKADSEDRKKLIRESAEQKLKD
jgi:tetratricopeptide (TPR) repeat protein